MISRVFAPGAFNTLASTRRICFSRGMISTTNCLPTTTTLNASAFAHADGFSGNINNNANNNANRRWAFA